jgi:hypothetical protein
VRVPKKREKGAKSAEKTLKPPFCVSSVGEGMGM